MTSLTQRHLVITDQEHGLPYSKGLTASAIMATGLSPARAYHVAEVLEVRLRDAGLAAVSLDELNALTLAVLREEEGEAVAAAFAKWQDLKRLAVPLVLLVGGATGVGKSTVASLVANRLGITRIIPTDAVREVMRSMLTADLFPALHASLFDVGRLVRTPLPPDADPVIIGFREQTAAVAVGIEALIQRAVDEGTDLIVEGAHVAPGFLDLCRFEGQAVTVQFVITVDDEEAHRSHFVLRARDARRRRPERYLEHFEQIRKIQRHVRALAEQHAVPTIPSYNLDATLARVTELIVERAARSMSDRTESRHRKARAEPGPGGRL
jgi:2-phosphoglycerate kinase